MRRLILVLLVIAVGVAINPSLRERAQPYVQPALDPIFAWKTRSDLTEIARLIDTERAMGHPLPTPRDFAAFLTRAFPGEGGELDPWGNPYYLRAQRRENVLGSPGPDGRPGTADDIVRSVPPF